MDALQWLELALCALATSVLTAVLGLGGGIILLAIMLLYLDPLVAIPLHAAVQITANATRTWIQRRYVAWPLLASYALPLLPAGWLGLRFAQSLPETALTAGIGGFVLLATWLPGWLFLGLDPARISPQRRFAVMGGVIGFLNPVVGAAGPLQGPFFLQLGLPRQGVVGTFAACQVLGHAAKLLLFGVAGFAFAPYLLPLLALGAVVVFGTWLGSRWLESLDERIFGWLYRGVLTAVSARLIVGALWPLLRAAVDG
jgi:uncharacterized membrane protein YfcA